MRGIHEKIWEKVSKAKPPGCFGGFNPQWPVCGDCAFQPPCKTVKEQANHGNWRARVYGGQKQSVPVPKDPWLEKQKMQARIEAMKRAGSEAAVERAYARTVPDEEPLDGEPARRVFHMPASSEGAEASKLKFASMEHDTALAFGLYRYQVDLQRLSPVDLGDEYDRLIEAGWSNLNQMRLELLRREVEARQAWNNGWQGFLEWANGEEKEK